MNENKIVRIDFIFSYWLFFWFILYKLNIVVYNPYLGLIIGLIVNSIMFILFLSYKNYYKAFLFVIVNFFIKIIPIYVLRNTKIQKKDIYILFILYIIYLIYKKIFDNNKLKKSKKDFTNYLNTFEKEPINTPFMYLLDKLIKHIHI